MIEKMISGGQTGADRAALDFAIFHGFFTGGSALTKEFALWHDKPLFQGGVTEAFSIYTGGHWKYEGKTGFYRIIYVEYHYGCSLLYIQWMLDREYSNNGSTEVLHTLSISEFNSNDHIERTFDKPVCRETKSGIRFKIISDSAHDDSVQFHGDLKVRHKFGEYEYKEKAKKTARK